MINIAVIFDQKIYSGGGYQQSINMLNQINKIPNSKYNFKYYTTIYRNKKNLDCNKFKFKYLKSSIFARLIAKIKINPRYVFIKSLLDLLIPINFLELELRLYKIDLVYFISPSNLAYDLRSLNYIYTIWDLCHLDNPEFPEIRLSNQFEIREVLYKKVLKKATAIITDCKENKRIIIKNYLINKKKITCIPFEASSNLNFNVDLSFDNKFLKDIFNKKISYLFYPAQYWAHKNHMYLLEALKIIQKKHKYNIGVIFTGSEKGNLKYLKKFVEKEGLKSNVIFLGYVNNDDLSRIYKKSLALVMPSYFGPSNLPPLEAFQFGLPVIYPNMKSFVKYLDNSGLFIDLNDPNSLVIKIIKLLENNKLRQELITKGYKYLSLYNDNNVSVKLDNIFKSYLVKRNCWK